MYSSQTLTFYWEHTVKGMIIGVSLNSNLAAPVADSERHRTGLLWSLSLTMLVNKQ